MYTNGYIQRAGADGLFYLLLSRELAATRIGVLPNKKYQHYQICLLLLARELAVEGIQPKYLNLLFELGCKGACPSICSYRFAGEIAGEVDHSSEKEISPHEQLCSDNIAISTVNHMRIDNCGKCNIQVCRSVGAGICWEDAVMSGIAVLINKQTRKSNFNLFFGTFALVPLFDCE